MTKTAILVTGGAGYIGSHVCKKLAENGYLPVTFDNLCSGNIEAVQWGPFEHGDLSDRARLKDVIKRHAPQAVMHFAALIRVGDSCAAPDIYYENNVAGSLALLAETREAGIRHIVLSSSAAVYGLPETSPIPENAPKKPINPYGNTKLAMEMMMEDFGKAYGIKYANLRYFNAAGADAEARIGTAYKQDSHIVPLLMRVAGGEMPAIKVFGNDYGTPDGTAVRDYVHITDLAQAHLLALEYIMQKDEDLTVNLGTNHGVSVMEMVNAAREATGRPIPVEYAPRRAGDPAILVADASLARQKLGWRPDFSNPDIILGTAWNWYKQQKSAPWGAKAQAAS